MSRCFFFFLLLCIGFNSAIAQKKISNRDMQEFYSRIEGTFSNEYQAKKDYAYDHIILRIRHIWPEKEGGYWFYAEEAMAKTPDDPYRQRVYHVCQDDKNIITSRSYSIKNEAALAGIWKDPTISQRIQESMITKEEGCATQYKMNENREYIGNLTGTDCKGSYKDEAYITKQVVVQKERMLLWTKGWAADGRQLWGGEQGGYDMDKKYPPEW